MTEFSSNGTTITFKRSLRRSMFYRQLRETLAQDEKAADHSERFQFCYVAAFVDAIDGMDWKPPQMGGTKKAWEASFQAFLDAVPDYDFFNGLSDAVSGMSVTADVVQRPNEALTDAEKADPNSLSDV